ncbi:MAG: imidazole glycerol phosphate synthase cyclase subunit [Rhodospirillales bacterium]
MLQNRIIPSLLLSGGRLVKGTAFTDHRDAGNPPTTLRAYAAQKADEALLIDIDATREGRGPDVAAVRLAARECSMPLTIGGGITSVDLAKACLDNGADKICLNGAALDDPDLISACAHRFGSQAVVVAIDVIDSAGGVSLYDYRTGHTLPDRNWLDWLGQVEDKGAGEIRLMDVSREGGRLGYNCGLLAAARMRCGLPIILEGGAGKLDHLSEAMQQGADALALGTMLVFSDNNIIQVKRFLKNAGHPIRL